MSEKVFVHGAMKYRCEKCGKEWWMLLEVGVEDHGKHGRPHQPCPFMILCDCGGFAQDISSYVPLPEVRELRPRMRYFAYDNSGKEDACGHPSIYKPAEAVEEANKAPQLLASALAITAAVGGPYLDTLDLPKIKTQPKICFADCPVCGAKHKTLYWHKGDYICLKCKEATPHD